MGNTDNNDDTMDLAEFTALYLNAEPKAKAAIVTALKVAQNGGTIDDMAAAIEDDEMRESMQRIIKEVRQESAGCTIKQYL